MEPVTAAALAAIPSLFKVGTGIVQGIRGRKLENQYDRPTYQIPQAQEQALAESRALTNTGMPGIDQASARLGQGTANASRAIGEAGQSSDQIIKGVTDLYDRELQATENLNMADADFRMRAMGDYMRQLQSMAGFQDKAWETNQQQPWDDAMTASAALREGGIQNVSSGVKGLTSAALMPYFHGQAMEIAQAGAGKTGNVGSADYAAQVRMDVIKTLKDLLGIEIDDDTE